MQTFLPILLMTVLAAIGQGLLAWIGLSLLTAGARIDALLPLQAIVPATCAGFLLAAIGLPAHLAERGGARHPWQTAWAQRAPVLTASALLPPLVILFLLLHVAPGPAWRVLVAVTGALSCAAALAAMSVHAVAQARPDAGRSQLGLAVLLAVASAMTSSLPLLLLVAELRGSAGDTPAPVLLAGVGAMSAVVLFAHWIHWREIDRGLPATAIARLLPLRAASAFARGGLPLLAWTGTTLLPTSPAWPWLAVAVAGGVAGSAMERRLTTTRPVAGRGA